MSPLSLSKGCLKCLETSVRYFQTDLDYLATQTFFPEHSSHTFLISFPTPHSIYTQYVTHYHHLRTSLEASQIIATDSSYLKLVMGLAFWCFLTFSLFTLFSLLAYRRFENKDYIFIQSCIMYLNQAQGYQRLRIKYKVVQ